MSTIIVAIISYNNVTITILLLILQIQGRVQMWVFSAVAMIQHKGLVKSEMVNSPVPATSPATIGVTAVRMPVLVSYCMCDSMQSMLHASCMHVPKSYHARLCIH
jgi:hypothetical protein